MERARLPRVTSLAYKQLARPAAAPAAPPAEEQTPAAPSIAGDQAQLLEALQRVKADDAQGLLEAAYAPAAGAPAVPACSTLRCVALGSVRGVAGFKAAGCSWGHRAAIAA